MKKKPTARRKAAQKAPAKKPGRIGRPRTGKRSNDAYAQVSAWIKRDTHKAVKVRLLTDEAGPKDFSELIQGLLEAWLRRRYSPSKKS